MGATVGNPIMRNSVKLFHFVLIVPIDASRPLWWLAYRGKSPQTAPTSQAGHMHLRHPQPAWRLKALLDDFPAATREASKCQSERLIRFGAIITNFVPPTPPSINYGPEWGGRGNGRIQSRSVRSRPLWPADPLAPVSGLIPKP